MSYYHAYRIHLNDTTQDGVSSIFRGQKESIFKEVLDDLEVNKKAQVSFRGDIVILHYKRLSNDIHLLQFVKTKDYIKPVLDDNEIKEVRDTENPFVYGIISLKNQVALIENNRSVFNSIETTATRFEKYLGKMLNAYGIFVNLIEIPEKNDLEDELSQFEMIKKIELIYEPPNFFKGSRKMDAFRQDSHEETNYNKLKIIFTNNYNGLKYNSKMASKYLGSVFGGIGRYVITGVRDKAEYVINSIKHQIKIQIKDDPETLELKPLEETMKDLGHIKDIDQKENTDE